jgi:SAM-dependent methyltransferase
MGIIFTAAAILLKAKKNNICFDKILTIGHQTLYLSKKQLKILAKSYNLDIDLSDFTYWGGGYADKFFKKFLNAKSVESLDYSNYENSEIIHDMNNPIDTDNHEKYDIVIDGGSLEHIFNFPVAISNCMKLLKKGGSFFMFTMCNNHTGHGFYQFSPELMFRIFQPENGFTIKDVILEEHPFPGAELSQKSKCYSVIDPDVLKCRIGLVSKSPILMNVHAIKTETRSLFSKNPIQSDYTTKYAEYLKDNSNLSKEKTTIKKRIIRWILNILPQRVKNYLIGKRQLINYSFSNKNFFKRWYGL